MTIATTRGTKRKILYPVKHPYGVRLQTPVVVYSFKVREAPLVIP